MIILAQYYAKESIENAYHALEKDQVIEMAKMIVKSMTFDTKQSFKVSISVFNTIFLGSIMGAPR